MRTYGESWKTEENAQSTRADRWDAEVRGDARGFSKAVFWRVTIEVVGVFRREVGAALQNRSLGCSLFARSIGRMIGTA